MNAIPQVTSDFGALKAKLKTTWSAGNYDLFSRYMEADARNFYERLNLAPGTELLDVACGSGQLALQAARDGVNVTGVDLAPNLVERARVRAKALGVNAQFQEADAESLPFDDGKFDVVASLIGAMFAPRPQLVAQEMLRVCAPGGTIAMGNWTPSGFVGKMFKVISGYIAPSGMPAPTLWGDEPTVRQRFGTGVSAISFTRRDYLLDYPFPPAEVVEFFREHYGPMNRAFASLDRDGQATLRQELEKLWSSENLASDGITMVPAEYLEVIATRV